MPETADAELLSLPLRSVVDVEEIEKVPLEEPLKITNFSQRIDLALAARDPDDIAIAYVEDSDIDREAQQTTFRDLRRNINRTTALLRSRRINRGDVVAVLLPAVPTSFWAYLGAMSAGIAFPVNWMLEADQLSRLLLEANARAVIALGPTPGFKIRESSIMSELPEGIAVWSGPGPKGDQLPDTDLNAAIGGLRTSPATSLTRLPRTFMRRDFHRFVGRAVVSTWRA